MWLVGKQQRLYDFVASRPQGSTNRQIKEALYWDNPNGGPDDIAGKLVPVMVWQVNKKLKQLRLKIASQGGPSALYKLHSLC